MNPRIAVCADLKNGHNKTLALCDTRYLNSISESGGMPMLLPAFADESMADEFLNFVDGILFTGGADYQPEAYGEESHPLTSAMHKDRQCSDLFLCRRALELKLPIMGICAGIQLLNIVSGGKLIQHLDDRYPHPDDSTHNVSIKGGRILRKIYGESAIITVNSYHHQAIDPAHIAPGFVAAAVARDSTIEAIELDSEEHFVLGVQWHPERLEPLENRRPLFAAFIEAASKFASNKRT